MDSQGYYWHWITFCSHLNQCYRINIKTRINFCLEGCAYISVVILVQSWGNAFNISGSSGYEIEVPTNKHKSKHGKY